MISNLSTPSAAAETLLDTGLHRVFISLGSDGVFAADRAIAQYADTIWHVPYKK